MSSRLLVCSALLAIVVSVFLSPQEINAASIANRATSGIVKHSAIRSDSDSTDEGSSQSDDSSDSEDEESDDDDSDEIGTGNAIMAQLGNPSRVQQAGQPAGGQEPNQDQRTGQGREVFVAEQGGQGDLSTPAPGTNPDVADKDGPNAVLGTRVQSSVPARGGDVFDSRRGPEDVRMGTGQTGDKDGTNGRQYTQKDLLPINPIIPGEEKDGPRALGR